MRKAFALVPLGLALIAGAVVFRPGASRAVPAAGVPKPKTEPRRVVWEPVPVAKPQSRSESVSTPARPRDLSSALHDHAIANSIRAYVAASVANDEATCRALANALARTANETRRLAQERAAATQSPEEATALATLVATLP